jgi:hypothetical protein
MTNTDQAGDRVREKEAMLRYLAGRPARDDLERRQYREFRDLDNDSPGFAKEGKGRDDLADFTDDQLHALAAREVRQEQERARRVAERQAQRERQRQLVGEPELEPPF